MPSVAAEFDCSVVIPAFNAAHTITDSVRSALEQETSCREVIVVDDGSSDGTGEVLRRFANDRVRVIVQANGGPSAARNAGIRAASSRYIAFLDSDDLWLPTYLTAVSTALQRAPDSGLVYTDAYVFDGATMRVRRRTAMDAPDPPPADRLAFLAELLKRNFIFNSATVPASVLSEIGGYTDARTWAEEYELWLRIVLAGYTPAYAPGPHALYRLHAGQLSSQAESMARGNADVFRELSLDAMPTAELRERLLERRARSERGVRILAGQAGFASRAWRVRSRLDRIRKRLARAHSWYREPPAPVAAALSRLEPAAYGRVEKDRARHLAPSGDGRH
jgi:glycosyltransferase involved in cell wall biosynthesis